MPEISALEKFFREPIFCAGQIPRQHETRELDVPDPLLASLEHDVVVSESQHALEKVMEFIDGLHHGWNLQVSIHLCDKIVNRAIAEMKPAEAKAKIKQESLAKPTFRCDVTCSVTELNPSAFSISGPRRHPNGETTSMPPPSILQRRASTDRNEQSSSSMLSSHKMAILNEKEVAELRLPHKVERSASHKMSFERKNINLEVLVTWIPLSASVSSQLVRQVDLGTGSDCRCWICSSIHNAGELGPEPVSKSTKLAEPTETTGSMNSGAGRDDAKLAGQMQKP